MKMTSQNKINMVPDGYCACVFVAPFKPISITTLRKPMPCQSVIVLPNRFGRTARRIVIPGLLKLRGILNVRTVYADTALKLTYNANRIDLKDILALLDQMETETNCIDGRQATSYLH